MDEVTQYEHVGAVEAISERFLMPVLEGLLDLFPFEIKGFHADNGSEYVNRHASRRDARAPALLDKLRAESAKSRARHSNDNALVDARRPGGLQNANVVRRWLGHAHIPRRFAARVESDRMRSAFTRLVLSPAVNYHRPCMFAVEETDADGRVRRRYPHDRVSTPCERLRGLEGAERHLKPGVTFAELDRVAHAMSDLQAMREVNRARAGLFREIGLALEAEAA